MREEIYNINLGNTDHSVRKEADSDFISFWGEQSKSLSWFKNWENILDWKPPFAKWFVGGKINASFNALDIHQKSKSRKTAIYWEGEDGTSREISYLELFVNYKSRDY